MHGFYYSNNSTKRVEAKLQVIDEHRLELDGKQIALLSDVSVSPRIGNTARFLNFPDGSSFETLENDLVDKVFQVQTGQPLLNKIYLWEKNKLIIVLSGVTLIAATYLLIAFGIPKFSKTLAYTLPTSISVSLANEVLENLDKSILTESKIPLVRQQSLRDQFNSYAANQEGYNFKLHFRKGNRIGANAFALPDGTIIMTDELVSLASNDYELHSVMLHEIGHVIHRHSLRGLIANSGLAIVLVWLTGDVVTAGSWVSLLPLILIESQYSQEIEREADGYALQQMKKIKISPQYFADIMEKMSKSHESQLIDNTSTESKDETEISKKTGTSWTDYFSSHPSTNDRMKRFEEAAREIEK